MIVDLKQKGIRLERELERQYNSLKIWFIGQYTDLIGTKLGLKIELCKGIILN